MTIKIINKTLENALNDIADLKKENGKLREYLEELGYLSSFNEWECFEEDKT